MTTFWITGQERTFTVDVVEHLPYDPAAYQNEAGWLCEDTAGEEYFISEGGRVDKAVYPEGMFVAPGTPKWIMGWGECPEVIERWKMLLSQEGS